MIAYRAYCYDGADKAWVADSFEADDDEEAICVACKLKCAQCELWEGRRFVAAFEDGQNTDVDPSELYPRA